MVSITAVDRMVHDTPLVSLKFSGIVLAVQGAGADAICRVAEEQRDGCNESRTVSA